MKVDNFRLIKRTGSDALDWAFKATVDITTGFFFKKTTTVEVYREYGKQWHWVATGGGAEREVYAAEMAFEAKWMTPITKASVVGEPS